MTALLLAGFLSLPLPFRSFLDPRMEGLVLLRQAEEALAQGAYGRALLLFQRAIPGLRGAALGRGFLGAGIAALHTGDYWLAGKYLQQALPFFGRDFQLEGHTLRFWAAYALFRAQELDQALSLLGDERGEDARLLRALIYLEQNRPDEVLRVLEPGENGLGAFARALALTLLGRREEALAALHGRHSPVPFRFLRGVLFLQSGETDSGLAILRTVPETSALYREALYFRCYYRYEEGDLQEALHLAQEFLLRYPSGPYHREVLFLVASAKLALGDTAGAVDYLERVTRWEDRSALRGRALFLLGQLLRKARPRDALAYLQDFLRDFPEGDLYPQALILLGEIAQGLKEDSLALWAFSRALDYPQERDAALFSLARTYEERGEPQKARDTYTILIREGKDERLRLKARLALGDLLLEGGDPEGAIAQYQKVVNLAGEKYSDLKDEARYRTELARFSQGAYQSLTEMQLTFARKYPDSPRAPRFLFESFSYFRYLREVDRASEVLSLLVRRYPDAAYTLRALEEARELFSPQRLLTYYRQALEGARSRRARAALSLGIGDLYAQMGDYRQALEHYRTATWTGVRQVSQEAVLKSGRVLMHLGNEQEAAELLLDLYHSEPFSDLGFEALKLGLNALLKAGRLRELIEIGEEAVRRYRGERRAVLLYLISQAYAQMGDWPQTLRTLEEARKEAREEETRAQIEALLGRIRGKKGSP